MATFNLLEPIDANTRKFTFIGGCRNAIFLAGPCPRENYSTDWRYQAFEILNQLGFDGTVITPTNVRFNEFEGTNAIERQIKWERFAMHAASAIVFWIPRTEDMPGFTTNVEFGEWYKKNGIYFGCPDSAIKVNYLKSKFQEQNKTPYSDLRTMLEDVVADLNHTRSDSFFTADTHFSQRRTLELSRRPFVDVTSMDLEMVSNWNKTVRMNDVVYHAGDFIDPDKINRLRSLLTTLNFRELHWTLGNYDRKNENMIRAICARHCELSDRKIVLYNQGECRLRSRNREYVIFHEPNEGNIKLEPGQIALYGHIHGRSFAKRNGFDLAADYHRYTPISLEQVEWFTNAMTYWDENVYSDSVENI